MSSRAVVIVAAIALSCSAQRAPYAGRRPIGYPEMDTTTTASALADRFGEDGQTTTTERLPIEANGDRDLVNRLSKLPIDKQPFWFINWKALEEHRKKPVSYELRPSPFLNQNSQLEQGRRTVQERLEPINQGRMESRSQGRMGSTVQERVHPTIQGRIEPINQGRIESRNQGMTDSIVQGRVDPTIQGRIEPINQGKMKSVNQGRMGSIVQGRDDPTIQGRVEPINQRRMDSASIVQGRTDPMNQRRMDPIKQGRMDPVGQGRMDPVHQGRLSDSFRRQDRRPITNSPPKNWQGTVDDFSSPDDSSKMFFY